MTTVVIPGERIGSERDLHDFLARELDFGPYYGRNLAALRDRLTTDVPRPVHIVWASASLSRTRLGSPTFDALARVLTAAADQDQTIATTVGRPDRLTVEIQD